MSKKVSNSRNRLIELMNIYRINQTELCRRTGLQKSALSNYLNGDREPRQAQISLIADPFNINPAWLMGYDVPMELPVSNDLELSDDVKRAMSMFKAYTIAPPEIQTAIDSLLKAGQKLQVPEIPQLKATKVPKPHSELPHLKKDSEK